MATKKNGKKKAKKATVAPQPQPRPRARAGLGRGLGALIGAQEALAETERMATAASEETALSASKSSPKVGLTPKPLDQAKADERRAIIELPIAEIVRSPWQPRQIFDAEALQELADSIRAHGVIQPLICRRRAQGGYELIAGERRLRAAGVAGLSHLPVIVIDAVDRDAAEMAIVENIQREDLNVIEEAEGYRSLADHFGLTQQEVAERVGKARASVANALRLLELSDEIKQLLGAGMLSVGHAKVLLSLPIEEEQLLLARRCVTDGLTVRALERIIQRRLSEKPRERSNSDLPESHRRFLLDRLLARLGTQVRLEPSVTHANGKRGKGRIEIDFYNNDDLDRLLTLLGVETE